VQVLPIALSAAAALAVAPGLRQGLADGGHTVQNYRGAQLPCPLGIIVVAAVALALGGLEALYVFGLHEHPFLTLGPVFVLGVAALGLFDDAYSGASRGWRGHGAAVRRGEFPTGLLKAVGTLGLAAYVADAEPATRSVDPDVVRYLLIVAVLVLATNLFNIVDLRPGRAFKGLVLVAVGCTISVGGDLISAFGTYLGAILVVGVYDLRERGILGDTGANLLGAVAGLMLVTAITSILGLAICAAVLLLVTAYGEFRSISAFVERTPGFRHLDSLGRIHNPRKDASA
jgi:UDP-N-acetylmuramyl pentapeptide phosphotransferase/UDP-N-acetylglucosamine-1-phosphate transferase